MGSGYARRQAAVPAAGRSHGNLTAAASGMMVGTEGFP
jgi:hypothetical protein